MNRPSRDVLEHSQANNPKHSVRCFIFARKRTRGEQLRNKQSDFLYCIDIPKYYIIICLIVTFLVLCYNIFVATPYTGKIGIEKPTRSHLVGLLLTFASRLFHFAYWHYNMFYFANVPLKSNA